MPDAQELRLGTRGSALALWQANAVARRVAETGGPPCRIVIIKTSGDRLQEAPLSEIGGKRLFVKEIEDALLKREIDLAVHSSKDMPAILPEGLTVAAVLPREDPLDAVVLPIGDQGSGIRDRDDRVPLATIDHLVSVLGQAPKIGTGSVRRIAQLTRLFPGARFLPMRGQSRYAAAQARRGRLRRDRARGRRVAAARLCLADLLRPPGHGLRPGPRPGHRRHRDSRR